jgi:hypothetical protein
VTLIFSGIGVGFKPLALIGICRSQLISNCHFVSGSKAVKKKANLRSHKEGA